MFSCIFFNHYFKDILTTPITTYANSYRNIRLEYTECCSGFFINSEIKPSIQTYFIIGKERLSWNYVVYICK